MRVGMGPKRPKRGCDHVLSVWVALPAHSLGAHACGGGVPGSGWLLCLRVPSLLFSSTVTTLPGHLQGPGLF